MNIFEKYLSYGLSVIPCQDKRPAIGTWKPYQSNRAPLAIAKEWDAPQVSIIGGMVSGGVVCLDFDTKNGDRYDEWQVIVNKCNPKVFSSLVTEQSPSGGYHVVFKTDKSIGNLKLAMNKKNECMIETRGEGGYFVCAPSPNYTLQFGDFSKIGKLSFADTDILIDAATSLNENIAEEMPVNHPTGSGITPFDDYDSKTDPCELLQKHGWNFVFTSGQTTYLKRPDKKDKGISASWNRIPGRFYCFSTSTQFVNNSVYKPSALYSILEHGGDYSAAARELSSLGFGEKGDYVAQKEPIVEQAEQKKVKVIDVKEIRNKILDIKHNGYTKGKTTGWPSLDCLFSVVKRQLTIITGVPSSGKSEFMDALAINLMASDGWKFAVFSPENYPEEMHYHKLIEKITGDKLKNTSDEKIDIAIKIINTHFFFIDALEEDIDLDMILSQTKELIKTKGINALIIDPWNEIELSKPNNINDSDFIGVCLRRARKFARRNNIHLFIIAHPTKMQRGKDGAYPIPELWDIAGSAHWRNKADNGLCVHRNYEDKTTMIYVQKIKFKYCGKQGETYLKYEEKSGRYIESSGLEREERREGAGGVF